MLFSGLLFGVVAYFLSFRLKWYWRILIAMSMTVITSIAICYFANNFIRDL